MYKEQSEREIKKIVPFRIASKRINRNQFNQKGKIYTLKTTKHS